MRVTLMHNPTAGEESHTRDALLVLLRGAGHDVRYQSTKEEGFGAALQEPADLVVVAGGDGTVRKVVRELGAREVPLAILPVGTANNIAKWLGMSGSARELVAGWGSARRRPLRIGAARGAWGERLFIEAVGLGLFPRTMRRAKAHEKAAADPPVGDEALARDLRLLADELRRYTPRRWTVILDGHDVSGEYLAVEAMNIGCIGPNLILAPAADPGDDHLDVVLVTSREREKLAEYLADLLHGRTSDPNLRVFTARHVELTWDPLAVHIDDEIGSDTDPLCTASLALDGGTLEFLVPRR